MVQKRAKLACRQALGAILHHYCGEGQAVDLGERPRQDTDVRSSSTERGGTHAPARRTIEARHTDGIGASLASGTRFVGHTPRSDHCCYPRRGESRTSSPIGAASAHRVCERGAGSGRVDLPFVCCTPGLLEPCYNCIVFPFYVRCPFLDLESYPRQAGQAYSFGLHSEMPRHFASRSHDKLFIVAFRGKLMR